MKVVIDTNVFVSGIFWKGKPELILDEWISSKFILLISKPIFEEAEQAGGNPYISKGLNDNGCAAFPGLMRGA